MNAKSNFKDDATLHGARGDVSRTAVLLCCTLTIQHSKESLFSCPADEERVTSLGASFLDVFSPCNTKCTDIATTHQIRGFVL